MSDDRRGSGGSPRHIADGMDRVVRSLGGPSVSGLRALFDDWESVVGDQLAGHCRPLAIDGNTLVLGVEDAAWASELQWLEAPLLEGVERSVGPGVVTSVRIRVEPNERR